LERIGAFWDVATRTNLQTCSERDSQ